MNSLSLGIPGVGSVSPGTHFCALYSGPAERDRLLFPFLEEGLRHGDTCLCLIDAVAAARRQVPMADRRCPAGAVPGSGRGTPRPGIHPTIGTARRRTGIRYLPPL